MLLQNRSLCRCAVVLDGSQRQHLEWHRDGALALNNATLAASYDALLSALGLT
jgi:hypothetical protein